MIKQKQAIFLRLQILNELLTLRNLQNDLILIKKELDNGVSVGSLEIRFKKKSENKDNDENEIDYPLLCKRVEKGRSLFRRMRWLGNDPLNLDTVKKMQEISVQAEEEKFFNFEKIVKESPLKEFIEMHLSPDLSPDDPLVKIVKKYESGLEPMSIPNDPCIRKVVDMFDGVPYVEAYPILIFLDIMDNYRPVKVIDLAFERAYKDLVEKRKALNTTIVL